MTKHTKQINTKENILYNNIVLLSRNKMFYNKFDLTDTFQNSIHLIFMHISFLFIKAKRNMENKKYNIFYQRIFDLLFKRIELNMREIGYGDTQVNKNMKFLVKSFYNILLKCENYNKKNLNRKKLFLYGYLTSDNNEKNTNNIGLVEYFDKYQTFCVDLSLDNVVKGDLNFSYK